MNKTTVFLLSVFLLFTGAFLAVKFDVAKKLSSQETAVTQTDCGGLTF